jgi:hypothetical protein
LEHELGIDLLNGLQGVCLSLRYTSDMYSSTAATACQGLLLLCRSCRLGILSGGTAAQSTPMSVTNYQLAPHRSPKILLPPARATRSF